MLVYWRSRLLFSSLRAHISEIISAVGAHISSVASPVFGTSPKIDRQFPKTSERFRTLPSTSERVRMHPGRSEQVQTRLRTYESFEKLAKTSRKLREARVRAVVVFDVKNNLPNPQGPVGENIAGGTGLGPEMLSVP